MKHLRKPLFSTGIFPLGVLVLPASPGARAAWIVASIVLIAVAAWAFYNARLSWAALRDSAGRARQRNELDFVRYALGFVSAMGLCAFGFAYRTGTALLAVIAATAVLFAILYVRMITLQIRIQRGIKAKDRTH